MTATNVFAPDGLVARKQGGSWIDYCFDPQGSVAQRTDASGTVTAFPVYDAHGNDVASLTRNGLGGCDLSDRRTYDAWGVVRSQQSGGDPKLRYCASLGHVQDDESGLVYMRARYYEPTSGRFISEDPGRHGYNWFVYAKNSPVDRADKSGCMDDSLQELYGAAMFSLGITEMVLGISIPDPASAVRQIAEGTFALKGFMNYVDSNLVDTFANVRSGLYSFKELINGSCLKDAWKAMDSFEGSKAAMGGLAARAITAIAGYSTAVMGMGIYMGVFDI